MESGNYKHGTTLVEILVVVAVIMILAGLVAGIATTIDSHSREKAVKATFSMLDAALQEYYDFAGGFPLAANPNPNVNSATLYAALTALPPCREILEKISEKVIKEDPPDSGIYRIYDPWGTVLNYTYTLGDSFPVLTSAGPDEDPNTTADNITNR